MPKDFPPPSKPEREQLLRERARDAPKPTLSLRPPGSIGAVIDASIARSRMDRAHAREQRIFSIDQALSAKKDGARTDFSQVKDKGLAKAHATKFKDKSKVNITR